MKSSCMLNNLVRLKIEKFGQMSDTKKIRQPLGMDGAANSYSVSARLMYFGKSFVQIWFAVIIPRVQRTRS